MMNSHCSIYSLLILAKLTPLDNTCIFISFAIGALTEAGIFSGSTSGTMFDRVVFKVKNNEANDTYSISFVISCSAVA